MPDKTRAELAMSHLEASLAKHPGWNMEADARDVLAVCKQQARRIAELEAECARLRRPLPATVWLLSEDGDADTADAFTAERDARHAAVEGAVAGLTDDDAMTEWQARDRDFAWRSSPFGIELYVDGQAQLTRIRRLEVLPAKQDPATCEHPRTDRLLIRDSLTECGLCDTTLAHYRTAADPLAGGKR